MLLWTAVALLGTSIGIALMTLPLLERRARSLGLVDAPGGRKEHARATPLVGGVAVILAVATPAVLGLVGALLAHAGILPLPRELAVHVPGILSKAPQLAAILLGSGILLLLGHLDDRRGLSPWTRLLVEAALAAVLAWLGVRVTLFLESPVLQGVLTVGFIVFITNAVNFIDNQNGLMAGVVLIGALHLLALAVATGQLFMAAILICLAGGLMVFLSRNFPRARVFAGDAGSLSIGFLLGALAVAFTYAEGGFSWKPLLVPLAVLAVPILDGGFVIVTRLLRGVHPFTPGRDHLSHRLMSLGLSSRRAVLLLWFAAFLLGLPALLSSCVSPALLASVWLPAFLLSSLLAACAQREEGAA